MRTVKPIVGVDSSLGRLQLAIELIIMIFKEIDNVYDAIMLGFTHNTLMVIGWEHIRALLVRDSAPWAGTRIICAGSRGDDVPGGLLSEEEEEEWDRLHLAKAKEGRERETLNLYYIFDWFLEEKYSPKDSKDYQRCMRLSPEERRLIRMITEEERYQWEKGWVLVNQTKEYVTSMAASRILPSMEATDARCFEYLLLSRICWSSDYSTAMNFNGDLHRGDWAGDRFVIVTVDVFEAMSSAKGWEDVSVRAAEWLREILLAGGEEYL